MAKFNEHQLRERPTQTKTYECEGAKWRIVSYTDLPSTSSMFIQSGFLPSNVRAFQTEMTERQNNSTGSLLNDEKDRIALAETAYFYAGLSVKGVYYADNETEYEVIIPPHSAKKGSSEREAIEKEAPAEKNWMWLDDIPFELILVIYNNVFSSEVASVSSLAGFSSE